MKGKGAVDFEYRDAKTRRVSRSVPNDSVHKIGHLMGAFRDERLYTGTSYSLDRELLC